MKLLTPFFLLISLCLPLSHLLAQTSKNISVSQSDSYTDHLALGTDEKDMDIMVKFVFNEEKNTLTVSLISYRTLFVFWNDTRYRDAVKLRRIRPDKLPYLVNCNPKDRFKLSAKFRKSIPYPLRRHIFKKWLEVDGLQPVDTELYMVNDYIEQTFDIQGKRNTVSVRLRDLMLLDETKHTHNSSRYSIPYGIDLNIQYRVSIQRNPCFALDQDLSAASNSLAAISKNYASLRKTAAKVNSDESAKIFREMQETLINQYPKNTSTSPCPDIQLARDKYNLLVDSIALLNAKVASSTTETDNTLTVIGSTLNAKEILANARILDHTVSRWLASNDPAEREDLVAQCRSIISDVNSLIGNKRPQTDDERNAISLFRKAEQYFKKVCK